MPNEDVPLSEQDEYFCEGCETEFDELAEYAYHECDAAPPIPESLEEGDPCPECDEPFDSDEWESREINYPCLFH